MSFAGRVLGLRALLLLAALGGAGYLAYEQGQWLAAALLVVVGVYRSRSIPFVRSRLRPALKPYADEHFEVSYPRGWSAVPTHMQSGAIGLKLDGPDVLILLWLFDQEATQAFVDSWESGIREQFTVRRRSEIKRHVAGADLEGVRIIHASRGAEAVVLEGSGGRTPGGRALYVITSRELCISERSLVRVMETIRVGA